MKLKSIPSLEAPVAIASSSKTASVGGLVCMFEALVIGFILP